MTFALQMLRDVEINYFSNADYFERKLISFSESSPLNCLPYRDVCRLIDLSNA